jgi:hypothetical protein
MAHIKALRTKWLAAFAEQQTGNGPAASAAAENEPAPEHALLPKKRLLESAGTGSGQQLDRCAANLRPLPLLAFACHQLGCTRCCISSLTAAACWRRSSVKWTMGPLARLLRMAQTPAQAA